MTVRDRTRLSSSRGCHPSTWRFRADVRSRRCESSRPLPIHDPPRATLSPSGAAFDRALAVWRVALGPEHPDVGLALNNIASVRASQGDRPGAIAAYDEAIALLERAYEPDHPRLVAAREERAKLDVDPSPR